MSRLPESIALAAVLALAAAIILLPGREQGLPLAEERDDSRVGAPAAAPPLDRPIPARTANAGQDAAEVVIREAASGPLPPSEDLLPEEIVVEVRDARTGVALDGVKVEVNWRGDSEARMDGETRAGRVGFPRSRLPGQHIINLWAGSPGDDYRLELQRWAPGKLPARRTPVVFMLEPTELLRYRAVDSTGLPLAGVHASTRWQHYSEQRTDADGFGWVDLPADEDARLLKLTARGYRFVRLDMRDGPPDQVLRVVFPPPASLRMRLPPGTLPAGYRATLSLGEGIIHNQFQTPYPYADLTESAEGTRCRVIYRNSVDSDDREVLIEASFNERGEAVLDGFLDVDVCSLELRFLEDRIARREIRLPEMGGELVVDLPAADSARHRELRVVGPEGQPLAAAKVTVAPVPRDPMGSLQTMGTNAPPPMETRTDAGGRVGIPLGKDGRCPLVLVHADGYGRRVFDHSELAQADWTVRLERGVDFRLDLSDRDGKALSSGDDSPVYGLFLHHALVDLGHGCWVEGDERTIARDAAGRRTPGIPDVWIFRDLPPAILDFTVERLEPEQGISLDTRDGAAMWALPVSYEDIHLPGFK